MIADTLVFAPPGLHGWAINALVCSQVLVGKTSPIAPGAHLAGGAADANDKPLTEGELEARSVAVRGRAFCPRARHRGRGGDGIKFGFEVCAGGWAGESSIEFLKILSS